MLSWLADIQNTQPIAHAVIILSLVAALGLSMGSVRVRGFSLGIAGTLFAGLIFAHFGYNLEPSFRSFIQEFGLILFVYTIGLQVGPGFHGLPAAAGTHFKSAGVRHGTLGGGGDGGAVLDFGRRLGHRRRHLRRSYHEHPGPGGRSGGPADPAGDYGGEGGRLRPGICRSLSFRRAGANPGHGVSQVLFPP